MTTTASASDGYTVSVAEESISNDYCSDFIPPEILEKLQAGAFRQLCIHLQERSDVVANMELMTLSGFCRNCLAKWMVVEARRLTESENSNKMSSHLSDEVTAALNALGYDEAAQHVYGMHYKDWKKRYQKKATDDQMKRYTESSSIHAVHNKELLAVRGEKPVKTSQKPTESQEDTKIATGTRSQPPPSLLSNVCCQDVEESKAATKQQEEHTTTSTHNNAYTKPYQALPSEQLPPMPEKLSRPIQVGILTVSDRASQNKYESGDLSGPAVQKSVEELVSRKSAADAQPLAVTVSQRAIVPDDQEAIQSKLKDWSKEGIDVILTTGGTGFGVRDVTPEATKAVLETECPGLMTYVASEIARAKQPMAILSRGTAGILSGGSEEGPAGSKATRSMVANLPGNPRAMDEILPILFPLLLYAIEEM